ncbi:MAG: nitroreductase [Anaerolineae bacterium]|nr:nitroreductase [Anaerolineae bacterium]
MTHADTLAIPTATQTLLQIIRERRTYPPKDIDPSAPVSREDIQLMLEAARWAPNHGLTEPWRFTVFMGEARKQLGERFAEAYRLLTPPDKYDPQAEDFQRRRPLAAPVWISIGMYRSGQDKMPEWEDLASVAIAAQHIMLVAHTLGYGSKWVSGEIVQHDRVRELVGLEPPSQLLGFVFVGRPASGTSPVGNRSPIETKVRWLS